MSNRLRLFMQHLVLLLTVVFFQPAFANLTTSNLPIAEKNYAELQEFLSLYQSAAANPWPFIPSNKKLLKRGSNNESVALLRERLQATRDFASEDEMNADTLSYHESHHPHKDTYFDQSLQQAVINFQERHGLNPDGVVGPNTLRELNISPAERVKQIEINMHRWEALSKQLGDRFIMVNVPDFRLYVFEDNHVVLSMKAIVGKPERETPEISSRVTRIVFNPYWNVPEKIATKDIVPKVLNNPDYLDQMNIRIFRSQDSDSGELSSNDVDWDNAARNGFPYRLRQEPGSENALGLVKFEFQNSNDVYLHDTPAKELFNQDVRTFSSGCIRLEDPFALVDYLMSTSPSWSEERKEDILGTGKTTYVKVARPTPIFITYITAWVDDNGVLNFRDDVYGRDN